jgi:3-oxoacyl-[acyl-carrier protein] reductase
MNLQNATVLVTGGTSGIGRGVARVLTEAGAKVAVTGRDEARLLEVARELGVLAIKADVASEADVERSYSEVLGAFGHLDVW